MTQNSTPDDGFAFGEVDIDWESAASAADDQPNRRRPAPAPAPVAPAPAPAPVPVAPAPAPVPVAPAPAAAVAPQVPVAPAPQMPVVPTRAPAPAPVPVTPPAAPAPAPAPVAPAPVAPAPVAPAPAPVAPAPVAPAPVAPAPVAPAPVAPAPVAPAPVAPAPVAPAPAPTPVFVKPTPAPAAPVYDAYTPTEPEREDPHAGRIRAGMEDLDTPEWANIVAHKDPQGSEDNDDAEPTFVGDGDLFEPVRPAQPAADSDDENEAKSKRKGKRAPKPRPEKKPKKGLFGGGKGGNSKGEPTAKDIKTKEFGGGRAQIKVVRIAVYAVIGVLILGGAKNIAMGNQIPTVDEVSGQVATKLGVTDYPTTPAEAFAVRFAREYLSYDGETVEARTHRLSYYSPAMANGDWAWDGNGKQSIVSGPYVSAKTVVEDSTLAIITVTAQVSTGDWLTLEVPVYVAKTGGMVIAGAPAYVNNPPLTTAPGEDRPTEFDNELSGTLGETVLPLFLAAWADSNSVELDRLVSKDATLGARVGLNGAVTFQELTSVEIEEAVEGEDESLRDGIITVLWGTPGGGTMSQDYRVVVVKGADGQWSIKDIKGGVLGDPNQSGTPYDNEYMPEDGSKVNYPVIIDNPEVDEKASGSVTGSGPQAETDETVVE